LFKTIATLVARENRCSCSDVWRSTSYTGSGVTIWL